MLKRWNFEPEFALGVFNVMSMEDWDVYLTSWLEIRDNLKKYEESIQAEKSETETITYGYAADNQRSIADRFIRIEEMSGTKYEMPFPSKEVTDSKALHYLLSYIDPGEEYTVVFGKKEN